MLPFWNERADDIPLSSFSELFHLRFHLDSITLGLIYSREYSLSSGIQAVSEMASFFFDINFYLMVIIAADFKIPVIIFTKPLSKKIIIKED